MLLNIIGREVMDGNSESNDPQKQILLKDIDRKKVEKTKKVNASKDSPGENTQNFYFLKVHLLTLNKNF